MRKLVISMFQSVDGFIEGPGGQFIAPEWSPDLDDWTTTLTERFDLMIFGSIAFRYMAAYWPEAEAAPETPEPQRNVARFMNGTRKIVFSRNYALAETWTNSEAAQGEPDAVLAAERKKDGKDIVLFAGARMAQSAMRTGLVDEWSILTIPALFGGGTRLFQDHGGPVDLRLAENRTMDTGAILARYVRA
ncbi:dihydrofolate reductase family protein [Halovulum sp. GXIMD14794]